MLVSVPFFIVLCCLVSFSSCQLDKIVQEKEAKFNEEKNNMWKELTEAFQKVQHVVMHCCGQNRLLYNNMMGVQVHVV